MTPTDPIPVLKKRTELLGNLVSAHAPLEVVDLRLATKWGPQRRANEPPFAVPALLADRSSHHKLATYADAARDWCYVKDCARGIAHVQLANWLHHTTYNIGSGRATSNAEIVAAIETALPGSHLHQRPGRDTHTAQPDSFLELTRTTQDTGYTPRYGLDEGLADFIAWLRAGHDH